MVNASQDPTAPTLRTTGTPPRSRRRAVPPRGRRRRAVPLRGRHWAVPPRTRATQQPDAPPQPRTAAQTRTARQPETAFQPDAPPPSCAASQPVSTALSRTLATLAALDTAAHLAVCWWEPDVGTRARRRRDVAGRVTQSLALPLIGGAWATRPGRRVRGRRSGAVASALGWSWLGDTLPALVPAQAALPVLIASFLPAQWSWTAALAPAQRRSVLWPGTPAWPVPLLGVVAAGAEVGRRVLPGSGALAPVGALYAASLTLQALAATGTGPLGTAGGALFMLSDSLIAVQRLGGRPLPKGDWLVMSTYLSAQVLLLAAVEHDAARHQPAHS